MRNLLIIPVTINTLTRQRAERHQFLLFVKSRRQSELQLEQLRSEKERLDYERRFALHQVGLERSETGARDPPSMDMLTSGCGRVPIETALDYPLAQPAGGGRHVAWTTHPGNASDSQCAREKAPVVGILREARVTTEWSGGASTGGGSSSTEPEIMHILPTNASLGARMPLPLEMPQPAYPLRLSHCSSEASSGSRMVDAGLPPGAAAGATCTHFAVRLPYPVRLPSPVHLPSPICTPPCRRRRTPICTQFPAGQLGLGSLTTSFDIRSCYFLAIHPPSELGKVSADGACAAGGHNASRWRRRTRYALSMPPATTSTAAWASTTRTGAASCTRESGCMCSLWTASCCSSGARPAWPPAQAA